MELFRSGEIVAAVHYACVGNQALYLTKHVKGKPPTGWLIDHDIERLMSTARRLGVRSDIIPVQRPLVEGQHVVLTGDVMERAMAECRQVEFAL